MPHLFKNPRSRCPAFQIKSPRKSTEIDVVIGIPTVKTGRPSYVYNTVKSLVNGMQSEQAKRCLIVVYVGEADDVGYVVDTAYTLNVLFRAHFGILIEVISPTKYWYPEWDTMPTTLRDKGNQSYASIKENLDHIFLISYVQSRGPLYLMLEDDVQVKSGFMTDIMRFFHKQVLVNPTFIYLNFESLGGSGKLFRTQDMMQFSAYLQMYYKYLPIEYLLEDFLSARVCGIDRVKARRLQKQYDDEVTQLILEDTHVNCFLKKEKARPFCFKEIFDSLGFFSSLGKTINNVQILYAHGLKYAEFRTQIIQQTARTAGYNTTVVKKTNRDDT